MRVLIIPAAGRGSRLGSTTPKPLVLVDGRPMLDHLSDLYEPFTQQIVVVAHPSFAASIADWARTRHGVSVAEQASPTGMLDAVLAAGPAALAHDPREVWITWADQVGVLPETLARLATIAGGPAQPALTLPTVTRTDPYIHFERDAAGRIVRLLQHREGDRMPAAGESDMGVFAMTTKTFAEDLPEFAREVVPGTATGERNFLPFVPWLAQRTAVATFPCTDPREAIGINTPDELRDVEQWLRSRRTSR
jgi:bifunctional N-acetylglucosamine-1-phosphate-uridyltransferase/glucosamine-1-phosphate-acetyltransferase GlmU-like protein